MRLLANFTTGLQVNATQTLNNGTNTSVITVTGIPDGQYTWTCAANSAGNSTFTNASSTRTINVDSTGAGSVGPLSFDGTFNNQEVTNARKFDFGKAVTIQGCTGSDAGLGGGSNATLTLKLPDISSFRFLQNKSGSNNTDVSFLFTETAKLGTYNASCTFTDAGGNSNTTSLTFEVIPVTVRRSGAAAIPGFKFPKGKTLVGEDTTNDAGALTAETSFLFKEGGKVSLNINGESHTFQVTEIGVGEITMTISSDPFDVVIKEEETKQVDIDGDGTADVAITLNQITEKGYADVTFAVTEGPAEVGPQGEVGKEEVAPPTTPTAQGQGMWLVVAVIVIVLIVGYFMIRKR